MCQCIKNTTEQAILHIPLAITKKKEENKAGYGVLLLPSPLLSRVRDHGALKPQLWSCSSLVHLCQSSDVHRGERGNERRDDGNRGGLDLLKDGLYFRDLLGEERRHQCPLGCETHFDLCTSYLVGCFLFCFSYNQTSVICAPILLRQQNRLVIY